MAATAFFDVSRTFQVCKTGHRLRDQPLQNLLMASRATRGLAPGILLNSPSNSLFALQCL
jgi:hypothetical protein